ncbi:M12 family metallopeptidase [Haliangium sp.]|uniref:M12 family metallopeptidase n=1 Tax=Haliangium sp. TaxID=2663208 RepID=UPI003D0C31DF
MSAPKICFDRLVPHDCHRPLRSVMGAGGRVRAISPKKQWVNGSTLKIRFLSGTKAQQDMVREFAPEWTKHANLHFEFTDDPRAQIRVSFDANDGAWSYVGTDNEQIPVHAATLNLGWQDRGVILHEFGHMIGLAHEHQSPMGGIEWNEEAVIRDLKGPPNYWDEATIRHNVLDKYTIDQINGTDFDPDSIMLYAFPASWTKNMQGTKENSVLSDLDKAFVAGEQMYPGRNPPEERAVELPVQTATEAEISAGGEEDLFRFEVTRGGEHLIETYGSTDVVMSLFGPDEPTRLIATDDDSGSSRNARIQRALQPGVYYVTVRHYHPKRTGAYRIQVLGR